MDNRIKIEILVLPNGKAPFIAWLESLEVKIQMRIRNRLTRIEHGNFGDCKSLGKGISEIRFDFGAVVIGYILGGLAIS